MPFRMNLDNPYLFHFTHYKNIPTIIQRGLIADSFLAKTDYINSGNSEIKTRRLSIPIEKNINVGDCVPFYFAPRSPMLYAQYIQRQIIQEDMVYIVCLLNQLISQNYIYYCSNMNAACFDAEFISDSSKILTHIDPKVMNLTHWYNTDADSNRRERRMAEFLVYKKVLYSEIINFVVYDKYHKDILQYDYQITKPIIINPNYYF